MAEAQTYREYAPPEAYTHRCIHIETQIQTQKQTQTQTRGGTDTQPYRHTDRDTATDQLTHIYAHTL